jgi:beta-barrel assembly-enhancing protease
MLFFARKRYTIQMKLHTFVRLAAGLAWLGTTHTQALPQPSLTDNVPLPPARLSLPQLGLSADDQLSLAQERILGRVIWRDTRSEPDVITDPLISDYLQTLMTRLSKPLGLPESVVLRPFVVNDPSLNAFAMPSGLMGIHSGLMLSVARESELAAVMAHEIGHVSQRHFARGLANQKDNAWIGLAGFAAALVAAKRGNAQADQIMQGAIAGSQAVQASKQLAFSRDMEREADAVGFELIKQAQYDGADMVRMLRRLGAVSSLNETGTVYARSHPGATERMANIEGRLKMGSTSAKSTATGVELDFLLMQARVQALLASTPELRDDAVARFEAQITAPSATAQQAAAQAMAGHYGLALIALQKNQTSFAAISLAQARKIPIVHPWLDALDFELANAPDVHAFLKRYGGDNDAAGLQAVLVVLHSKATLSAPAAASVQIFLQNWLTKHPQDDLAWGALASIYTLQNQPVMGVWAQAEQTAAMGVWASSITLLSNALRSGEATVSIATQNQWRERLQVLRQIATEEKTLMEKFK